MTVKPDTEICCILAIDLHSLIDFTYGDMMICDQNSVNEAIEIYNAVNLARKWLGIRSYNKWVVLKAVCKKTNSPYMPSMYGLKTVLFPYVDMLDRQILRKKDFYNSTSWKALRYKALKLYGRKCICCGATPPDAILHVDHIKPRSKYPELELDIDNLQVLCSACNIGKGNRDSVDFR